MTVKKVDLGLDLLINQPEENKNFSIEKNELFLSAQILWKEGWVAEAKKLLRKVLRWDPSMVSAQKLLDEILSAELADHLGREKIKKDLGLSSGDLGQFGSVQKVNPNGIADRLLEDLFEQSIDNELNGGEEHEFQQALISEIEPSFARIFALATPRELMDYAVMFQEMNLKPLSLKALRKLITFPEFEELGKLMQAEVHLREESSSSILALLNTGIAFTQPDLEVIRIYLVARALELQGDNISALKMYKGVIEYLAKNPKHFNASIGFRDTRVRIKVLQNGGWVL